jgi:putative adhesin
VGSNQDIELSSNVGVFGDATPGPSGVVIDSAPAADVYGATSPADEPVVLDPVVVPSIPLSGGPLTVAGAKTVGPGPVHYKAVTVKAGGTLKIKGPATVVIDDLAVLSNANVIIDSASGPVEIYGTGDFELRSNSTITTLGQHAKDLSVFLTGDTDAFPAPIITLNSNSDFIGTIYAPEADLKLDSNFELFGAVVAESVTLASNSALHFDEDLLYEDGVEPQYEQLSWRVLSAQEE